MTATVAQVVDFAGKGRGVVATKAFARSEFVVEYSGELISLQSAKTRERKYARSTSIGCYMYYFKFNNICYWSVL